MQDGLLTLVILLIDLHRLGYLFNNFILAFNKRFAAAHGLIHQPHINIILRMLYIHARRIFLNPRNKQIANPNEVWCCTILFFYVLLCLLFCQINFGGYHSNRYFCQISHPQHLHFVDFVDWFFSHHLD